MILPIISSLSREVMTAVPHSQREAVLALGATRWEMIRMAVLRNARIGIVGAIILGLGRALGETMAVAMVIGDTPEIHRSLFSNGSSMASVIANEYAEAVGDMHLSALTEIGLALFIVTIIVNALAQVLIWAVTRGTPRQAQLRNPNEPEEIALSSDAFNLRSQVRTLTDHLVTALAILATIIVIAPLIAIFVYLLYMGASSLNLDFFTKIPKPVGESGGGMANAIVGSGMLLAVASVIGVPIGIGGGIFLAEFGRGTKLAHAIRFTADVLNGVPSIVMGLAAYALIVHEKISYLPFTGHFSAMSGGVALGFMMIPTVCRTTEEMLLMVPHAIREAALGLGVPNWRSVLSITVKTASPGIITGCMLAFARVAGETAPLIFTALGNNFWSTSLNEPIAALPLQIYVYALSPYDDWHRLAWAGSLVLIVLIVLAVSLVRFVTSRGVLKGAS